MSLLNLVQLNTSQTTSLQTVCLWQGKCWSEGVCVRCWPLLQISWMILGNSSLFKADVPPYICFLMRWPCQHCWSLGPSRTGSSEVCCNVMLVQLQLILCKSSKQTNKQKKQIGTGLDLLLELSLRNMVPCAWAQITPAESHWLQQVAAALPRRQREHLQLSWPLMLLPCYEVYFCSQDKRNNVLDFNNQWIVLEKL